MGLGDFSRGNSEAFLRCEPIAWNCLTLYPIRVSQYEEFRAALGGMLLSQQTLPARYVSMRYLAALYAIEFDALAAKEPSPTYFSQVIAFLTLALQLPISRNENGTKSYPVKILVNRENPRELAAVEVQQGETLLRITPKDFNELRPLLAEQNGLRLPDEANNAELEEVEREIAAAGGRELDYDVEALVYSVAYQWGKEPEELWDWPIRKFLRAQNAADRSIGHFLSYLAETGGNVKFTGGNPWPSWKFDRKAGLTAALIPMAQFRKQMGDAVEFR